MAAPLAGAQTVTFSGYETTLPVTPAATLAPASVVVNASGDVFVSDFGNGQVVELTPSGTGYTQNLAPVASASVGGLVSPRGLALDTSGNLYIADYGGDKILKVACAISCGTPTTLVSGLSSGPQDMAFDPYGYLWFTLQGDAHVWSVSTSGGTPVDYSSTYFSSTPFSQPEGLAWQTTVNTPNAWQGNLFISDYNNDTVTEWTWNGSAWVPDGTVPASGLTNPTRMAVDSAGDLYIADMGNNRIVEVPWTGSGWGTQVTVPTSTLKAPVGVAVDSSGNIYIADWQNHRVLKESTGAVNFGSVAVGTASSSITLRFIFGGGGTTALGSAEVLTQGGTGLDFAGAGTCVAGQTYNSGDTCTINATFTPQYPGARYGAAVLEDTSGTVLATAYLYGSGTGPQITFLPGVESTLTVSGSKPAAPAAMAADASGNIYIADPANGQVVKETPSAGGYTQTVVASGFTTSLAGVAVDGAGNVYIADAGAGQLYKVQWNGSQFGATPIPLLSGSYAPAGVAVDGSGDVFFTSDDPSSGTSNVYELSPGGSPAALSQFPLENQDVVQPAGVALDAAGNLFVSYYNYDVGSLVAELPWTGSGWANTIKQAVYEPNTPASYAGIAVDDNDNLYLADVENNKVWEAAWNGNGWNTPIQVQTGSTLSAPEGLTLDSRGNLYIGDTGHGRALKEDYADPPSLSFANTVEGSTSSDSPQTVEVLNAGNQNLLFEGASPDPSYPSDFPENMSDANLCASGTPLQPGFTCDLSVNFTPQAGGMLSEYLVLTDNNLNASGPHYAVQNITLNGDANNGAQVLLSPSVVNFGNQSQGPSGNPWTLNFSNESNLIVNIYKISIIGAGSANFNQSNNCGPVLYPYSSCQILVYFTPQTTGTFYATLQVDDNGANNPHTASLSGTGTPVGVSLSPSSISFGSQAVGTVSNPWTVTLNNTGNSTLKNINIVASTNFSVVGTSCGTTLGPYSTCDIYVSFAPTVVGSYLPGTLSVYDNADPSPQTVPLNGTGLQGSQTITFNLASPVSYASFPQYLTLTATASSGLPVTYTVLSGPGSVSGSVLKITGFGTITIAANQFGNANWAAAPEVVRYLEVNKATPVITWATPAAIPYGTALSGTQLDASASVGGTFVYSPAAGAILTAGTHTLSVTFTPTDTTDYNTATATVTLTVLLATPAVEVNCAPNPITWIPPSGSQTATCTATVGSGATGTLTVYWGPGNTTPNLWVSKSFASSPISLTLTGFNTQPPGFYTVKAVYSGDANNNPGSATTMETIDPAPQTIVFPQPATPVLYPMTTSATLTASATSLLPITYSVVSGPATVTGNTLTYTGAGTVVVQAAQPGNAYYAPAVSVQDTITVITPANSYIAPTEPVGTQSLPQTAAIQIPLADANFTLGSIAVVTQGATGLDFQPASGGTCTVGKNYQAGDACTVNYTFKPLAPGMRLGAIEIFDNSATPVLEAVVYLSGLGAGPQIVFTPGAGAPLTESTLPVTGAQTATPNGIAVDAAGNIYLSDTANHQVVKLTPAGNSYTQTTVADGFGYPNGVAVDGAGNVYIAGSGCQLNLPACSGASPNGQLYKVSWNGSSYGSPQPLLTPATHAPAGVAVDAGGDVFFTDGLLPYVGEIPLGGSLTQLTQFSGLTLPSGLAFDASGNLFVTDSGGASVWELQWTGNGWANSATKVIAIPSSGGNPSVPSGIVLDAAEDLYVADYNLHYVYKYPSTGGGAWGAQTIVPTSKLDTAAGVALDGEGNLYVTENDTDQYSNSRALKEDYADPPSLSFAQTAYGATSSDSPKTVILANIGNANLISESVPIIPPDFDLSASTCATLQGSGTMTPAQSCNLVASFNPWQVGTLNEDLTLADNNLNVATATQTIQFSGTAVQAANATIRISNPPANAAYGGSFTPTYAYTGTGTPAESVVSATPTVCTVSGATVNFVGVGTCTLTASASATTDDAAVTGSPQGFSVGKGTPLVAVSCTPNPATYSGGSSPIATCTVTVTAGSGVATGTVTVEWGPGATATNPWATPALVNGSASVTGFNQQPPGGYTVEATYNGDTNNNGGESGTTGETIVQATPTISISNLPVNAAYGGSFTPTYAYTGTGTPAESVASATPSVCTVSGAMVNFVGVGTCTLTASAGATTDDAAVTGSPQSFAVGQAPQSINWVNPASSPDNVSVAANDFPYPIALAVNASSQLPVTLSIQSCNNVQPCPASFGGNSTTTVNYNGSVNLNFTAGADVVVAASQSGNTDFAPAAEVSTEIVVTDPPIITSPSFTLASTANALTLQAGQSGYVTLALEPAADFAGTVSLSCSGLPSGVTCSFAPTSLTADGHGTPKTSVLTVSTADLSASSAASEPGGRFLAGILFLPGLLCGILLAWRRRKLSAWAKQLLVLAVLSSTLAGVAGCGGTALSNALTSSHTITISARATASGGGYTTQTGTLTLTITQ